MGEASEPRNSHSWRLAELERWRRDIEQQRLETRLSLVEKYQEGEHKELSRIRAESKERDDELEGRVTNLNRLAATLAVTLIGSSVLLILTQFTQ
jgi:hypothetical protein